MYTIALVIQIILAIAVTVLILLQAQGSGLGAAWGGGGETYHTRRGLEKVIFIASIILTVLFAANSVLLLVLTK